MGDTGEGVAGAGAEAEALLGTIVMRNALMEEGVMADDMTTMIITTARGEGTGAPVRIMEESEVGAQLEEGIRVQ